MEVVSTNHSGNRLPPSVLKNLAPSSQTDSAFEMLLDLPIVSASYIKPSAEGPNSTEEPNSTAPSSSQSDEKPRDDKEAVAVEEKTSGDDDPANLVVSCMLAPNATCNLPKLVVENKADVKANPVHAERRTEARVIAKTEDSSTTEESLGPLQNVEPLSTDFVSVVKPKESAVVAANPIGPMKQVDVSEQYDYKGPRPQKSEATTAEPAKETKQQDRPDQTRRQLRPAASPSQAPPISQSRREQRDSDRPAKWYERNTKAVGDIKSMSQSIPELKDRNTKSAADLSLVEPHKVSAEKVSSTDSGPRDLNRPIENISIPTVALANQRQAASAATAASVASSTGIATTSGSATGSVSSPSASRLVPVGMQPTAANGFAANGSAVSATESNSTQSKQPPEISRAEKARMVQRVARSFSRVGSTGGNVNLKLHPPELGALAVQVKIEGKNMSAKLVTESAAARDVILESLPQLRSRLAEQGFDILQFTVDVASDGSALDNQTGQGGAGQGGGAWFGGQPGRSSDSSWRSTPPSDLRRSRNLRRQLDRVGSNSPINRSFGGRGVDITA